MLAKDAAFNAETADFTGHEEEFRMAGYADTQHLHNRCATSSAAAAGGVFFPPAGGVLFRPLFQALPGFKSAYCSNPLLRQAQAALFMLHALSMHASRRAHRRQLALARTHSDCALPLAWPACDPLHPCGGC